MSYFSDVGDFHRKFDLPVGGNGELPTVISDKTFLFRYQFLQEELQELLKAHRSRDLVEVADALADLVYVALGTAHMYHIPLDEVWNEVQRSNMKKERANGPGDVRSKRGSALDVVKPHDWTPPDIAGVMKAASTQKDKI